MTNATKTLLALFATLLALTLGVRWTQSPTASEAFQGPLLTVDSTQIAGLSLRPQAPSSPLQVARGDTTWTVRPPDTSAAYAADRPTVENALQTLLSLTPSAVVTRQRSKHARYGVDSTGTHVAVQTDDGKTLRTVIVGQSQPGSRRAAPTTYVRIAGRPDVYAVNQMLASTLPTSTAAWRDKSVWRVDRARITRVDFAYPADSSFSIRRVGGGTGWVSSGDTLASRAVSRLLRPLSVLNANGFAEGRSPSQLAPRYTLRLHMEDGTTRAVRLQPTGSGTYHAAASGYPHVFTVSKNRWDRAVLQPRAALLASPEDASAGAS
jgi:hypothetical protein